jgi:hypothetical protein
VRPSILDLERLLRQHRGGIQQLLSAWLAEQLETEPKACG